MKRKLLLMLIAVYTSSFVFGQLNENFDGATFPPSGWTTVAGSGAWDQSSQTADHTTGSDKFARYDCYNIYGATPAELITPKLNVTSGDKTFAFWANYYYISGSYGNSAELYVDVSDDNGATWTQGTTNYISGQQGAGWFQTTIDLSNYEGQNYVGSVVKIKFRAISDYGSYNIGVDDVTGPAIYVPACPDPTTQTESNITTSSAELGWTENGSATTWDIEWGPTGFTQGSGTTISGVTSNPYTLSGLSANTTYDWYVRADCGGGSTSDWTGPSTFTTEVAPNKVSSFPYYESFETDFGQWKQMNVDDFDWTRTSGSTPSSGTGPSSAYSGSYYVYTESSSPNYPNKTAGLILAFDVSTLTTPQLTFAYHMYGAGMGTLQVDASTDNGGTWNTVWSKSGDQGNQWNNATVLLSSYSGNSNLYLRFWGETGSSYTSDMAIDTIDIREAPSCPDPTDQTESNITTSSAELGWTENGSATTWDIEYGPTGFTQGSGTTISGVTSNPYTLSGLSANTTYDWYVRADCGGGSTSDWTGPSTFTTQCNAVSTFPYSEDFATWPPSCWTIDKTITGSTYEWKAYSSGGVNCAKANFWAQSTGNTDIMYTPTFDVSGLTTPSFYFKWSHQYNSSYPNDSLSVEVSDDGGTTWHKVWGKGGSNLNSNDGAGSTAPGTFATTSDIDLSSYGTSIIIRFYAYSGYGPDLFVDDVVVRELPTCPVPSAQTVTNITSSSADLGWTENGSATTWDIEYGPTGFTQGSGTTLNGVTNNPYNLTGLSSSTSYDWYVRSSCGGGDYSSWVGPNTFSTTLSNDNCSDAVALTAGYDTVYTTSTNVGATDSNNNPDAIPAPGCGNYQGGDVWFTVTVPSSGYLGLTSATVTGSSLTDGAMAYYTGTCGSLTLGACNDDGGPGYMPELIINDATLAGQTVYVRFWEYGNNSFGEFKIAAFTHPTAAVWDGSTDNNWFDKTNWDVNGVPGANTVVTIPIGLTNYPTLTAASTIDSLIIESDATGSGSILGDNFLTINKHATVQRYVTKGKWHDFAASTQGQTLNAIYFNGNPSVWLTHYNENDDSRTYLTDLNRAMPPGEGFEIWVDASYSQPGVTINFTGDLQTGDVTLNGTSTPPISFTDAAHGYNLIGNPFASAIKLTSGSWAMTGVSTQFWVWDPASNSYKDYNTSTPTGSLTDGIVPVGQGFFIQTTAASPSVTIPSAARVHSNQGYYKNSNEKDLDLIKLKVSGGDELNIAFKDGATEEFEIYDTRKMFSMSENVTQIYSVIPNETLSLNTLPVLNPGDEEIINVGLQAGTTGEETITAEISMPDDINIILEDTKINKFQDLNENPVYKFNANTNDNPLRFRLHVGRNVTGIDENSETAGLSVYSYENNLYIVSKGDMVKQSKTLEIYDIMGRRLINKVVNPAKVNVIPINSPDTYLIVKVIAGNNVYTHKIFIK